MALPAFLSVSLILVAQVMTSQFVVVRQACGETKNCLSVPESCSGADCRSLLAWSRGSNEDSVSFQFSGRRQGKDDWIAVAFAEDVSMTQSVIIFCTTAAVAGSSTVVVSWTQYTDGQRFSQLTMSEIGINGRGEIIDGLVQCRFDLAITHSDDRIPLLSEIKYILLLSGQDIPVPSSGEEMSFQANLLSPTPTDFSVKSSYSNSRQIRSAALAATGLNYTVGCGETKGCFFDDDGSLVTFAMSVDGQYLNIEMQAEIGGRYDWIAVGFAQNPAMFPAYVLECVYMSGSVDVRHSFNPTYGNTVIDSRGIIVLEASYVDDRLQCSCRRPVVFGGDDADPRLYNLTEPYHLLLGKGLTDANDPGRKMYHSKTPKISGKLNLNETFVTDSGGMCRECSIKAHGCLMISGWMLLTSIGIFMPRYFKTSLGTRKFFELAAWFFIHRSLMLLTLAVTASSFILIFVLKDGKLSAYADTSPSYFWAHAPIGITIMILVIVNPVMAIFRCGPTDSKRPIFNWLHLIVGTSAQILAVINIFFGLLIGESSGIVDMLVFWLMIAFVGFHLAIEILLTFNKYRGSACLDQNGSKNINMETANTGEKSSSNNKVLSDVILLGIYIVTVTGLWIAMMIIIVLS